MLRVRVDADLAGNRHRLFGNRARVEIGVGGERLGGGERVGSARSDRDDAIVGLDQVAVARQQERRGLVEHDEHRLEPAQDAIGAPVLRQLDRRALQVAAVLLELGLETGEEREGIGRRSGKAGEDALVVEPADLAGALLDDGLARR